MTWQSHASCRGMTALFAIPELHQRHRNRTVGRQTRARISRAKAICKECPVIDECRTHYLEHPDSWMIAGGLTPRERLDIRRGRGVA